MFFFGRTKDSNGDTMGSCEPNPFLNALTYDGEIIDYSANVIAENLCSQVNEDGHNKKNLGFYCRLHKGHEFSR